MDTWTSAVVPEVPERILLEFGGFCGILESSGFHWRCGEPFARRDDSLDKASLQLASMNVNFMWEHRKCKKKNDDKKILKNDNERK